MATDTTGATDFTVEHFRTWVRKALPALNCAVEADALGLKDFLGAVGPWVQECAEFMRLGNLDERTAEELLVLLAFCVNSAERHAQATGLDAGEGLGRLEHAEELLRLLSDLTGLPPHGSIYTVWLLNTSNPPLTFTGDPQEEFFHASVLLTDALNRESCRALRPITKDDVPLFSEEAVEAMALAASNAEELKKHYKSFMVEDPETGQLPITPEFFATRMRTYLASYPIRGELKSGGNAGDLPSQIQLDRIIGTTIDQTPKLITEHRMPNLTAEDRRLIEADFSRPSLFELFLDNLGLTLDEAEKLNNLAAHTARLSDAGKRAAKAYGNLVKAHGDASAAHWALIVNFLIRIDRHVEDYTSPIKDGHGTGGIPHDVTKAIMEGRQKHPAKNWTTL